MRCADRPNFPQLSAKLGGFRLNNKMHVLSKLAPTPQRSAQVWPIPNQSWPMLGDFGPKSGEFGPDLADPGPKSSGKCSQHVVKHGPTSTDLGRIFRPNSGWFDRIWPDVGKIGLHSEGVHGLRSRTMLDQRSMKRTRHQRLRGLCSACVQLLNTPPISPAHPGLHKSACNLALSEAVALQRYGTPSVRRRRRSLRRDSSTAPQRPQVLFDRHAQMWPTAVNKPPSFTCMRTHTLTSLRWRHACSTYEHAPRVHDNATCATTKCYARRERMPSFASEGRRNEVSSACCWLRPGILSPA